MRENKYLRLKLQQQRIRQEHLAVFIPKLAGGGAEKIIIQIANSLAERGISIDFLVCSGDGVLTNKLAKNINLIELGTSRTIYSLVPLLKYLRTYKPETFLSFLNHTNLVSILARFLSGISTQLIISERNTPSVSLVKSNTSKTKNGFILVLIKILYRFSDQIIVNSVGIKMDLIELCPILKERIQIIYNPIDLKQVKLKVEEKNIHPWLNFSDEPVILSAGRLVQQKDFSTLIKAFKIARSKKRMKLLILGEGLEKSNLLKLIESLNLNSQIELTGYVENPYSFFSLASLFVLSSIWEGFPNVLIEALACGIPIVSTDCKSGPREVLDNGKYGKLIPTKNEFLLADAILKSLSENHDTELLQNRAKIYSKDVIIEKYISTIL